jgi:hypothetical protein
MRSPAAAPTALLVAPAATPLVHKTGGVQERVPITAASRAPAVVGAASSAFPDRAGVSAGGSAAVAIAQEAAPETSAPQPAEKLSVAPPASAQASSPHLSAAEIAALLAHGSAALRKGDIAAARLFYQRAFDAGEGRGALGMGATYDPAFLRGSRLRNLYGDPAAARVWYLHALMLGAAGAERRLVHLQARAAHSHVRLSK